MKEYYTTGFDTYYYLTFYQHKSLAMLDLASYATRAPRQPLQSLRLNRLNGSSNQYGVAEKTTAAADWKSPSNVGAKAFG